MRFNRGTQMVVFGVAAFGLLLAGGCTKPEEPKVTGTASEKPKTLHELTHPGQQPEAAPVEAPKTKAATAPKPAEEAKPQTTTEAPKVEAVAEEPMEEEKPKTFAEVQSAATAGDAASQAALGDMYKEGKGAPQDMNKALESYTKSAAQGNGDAQCALGEMYRDGKGVPKDPVKAYMWFNVAAQLIFDGAAEKRDAMKGSLSQSQIAEAEKMTADYLKKLSGK